MLVAGHFASALLVVAGLVAYHNSFRGAFILDDLYAIPSNPTIRSLWPPGGMLSPPAHSAVTGRPLVNLSLAINYAFGGLDVTSYHVFNLVIHVLAALVLFGVVRRTLGAPGLTPRYRDQALGIATAAALLWIVHPLMTESVDYTIQRTELLMGLFFLLTLYLALRGFESQERKVWHATALVTFALGLGSKEVIAVAPAVVLAYDRLFWSASWKDALRRHRLLYGGLVVVLVSFVLLVGERFSRTFAAFASRKITPWEYALTQSGVIVHYLRLAVWPTPLVADYAGWPIATSVASVLPSLIFVTALLGLTLWGVIRRRKLAFLGVFFFLVLAPTSSFRPLPNEIAAERRMYLPLAAAVVLVLLGANALLRSLHAPHRAGLALVAALAATFVLVTVRRNEDYRTALSFWSDVVAKRPDNPRARLWLGNYLYRSGKSAEAYPHLEAAARLRPDDGRAQYGFGIVLDSQGRRDEAIERYRIALRIDPKNTWAHNALGNALAVRRETDEAVGHYREAIRIDPGYADAYNNLAVALVEQGRTDEAMRHFETALRLKPDLAVARRSLNNLRNRTRQ
jgi:Flp pilus assembly protein TadD